VRKKRLRAHLHDVSMKKLAYYWKFRLTDILNFFLERVRIEAREIAPLPPARNIPIIEISGKRIFLNNVQ